MSARGTTAPQAPGAGAGSGWGAAALLALLVATSRLPFLNAGYGTDTDAWKLAWAARAIGQSGGGYTPSRLPGFPVQEYASALVWRGGPPALNGLTALFGVVATLLLFLAWRRLRGRDGWLAALAFAFTPTVFIASVSSMDYLWAVAFLMAAFVIALDGRALAAGVMLGMATGSRITSAVFILPLAVLIAERGAGRRVWRLARLAGAAAVVGAAWFLPAYRRFGSGFLSYYEPQGDRKSLADFIGGILVPGSPPFSPVLILGQGTVGVFGLLGAAAVAIAVLGALWAARPGRRRAETTAAARAERALTLPPGRLALALALGVILPAILYVRLPHDEGYLIPCLPFALMLLGALAPRSLFRACALALIAAPFVLGADVVPPKKGVTPLVRSPLARGFPVAGESLVVDPLRGPLLMDADKRNRTVALVRQAVPAIERMPADGMMLVGVLNPVLFYYVPNDLGHPRYVDMLRRRQLEEILGRGRPVYYLPDVRWRTLRFANYDLRETAARPAFPESDPPPDRREGSGTRR